MKASIENLQARGEARYAVKLHTSKDVAPTQTPITKISARNIFRESNRLSVEPTPITTENSKQTQNSPTDNRSTLVSLAPRQKDSILSADEMRPESLYYANLVADYHYRKAFQVGPQVEIAKVIEVDSELDVYNGGFVKRTDGDREWLQFIGRGDERINGEPSQNASTISGDYVPLNVEGQGKWQQNGLQYPDAEDPTPVSVQWGDSLVVNVTKTTRDLHNPRRVGSWYPGVVKITPPSTEDLAQGIHEWKTKMVAQGEAEQKDLLIAVDQTPFKNAPLSEDGRVHGYSQSAEQPQNKKKRIAIVPRYRYPNKETGTVEAGFRLIWADVENPEDLQAPLNKVSQPNSGYEIEDGRGDEETQSWPGGNWFGFLASNKLTPHIPGRLAMLSHDAMHLHKGDKANSQRPYVMTIREYERDGTLAKPPMAIATTEDVPPVSETGVKERDLQHTLFIKQLLFLTDNDGKVIGATAVGGARDNKMVALALSEVPFSAPVDTASSDLVTIKAQTAIDHGLPVSQSVKDALATHGKKDTQGNGITIYNSESVAAR